MGPPRGSQQNASGIRIPGFHNEEIGSPRGAKGAAEGWPCAERGRIQAIGTIFTLTLIPRKLLSGPE